MSTVQNKTDAAVLAEIGERLGRRRLALNLTQAELAREAGISKRTLIRLEGGESTQTTNLIRVLRGLGLLRNLDAFLPTPIPSPLEWLEKQGKRRKRATGRSGSNAGTEWTWDDENGGEG